jgi:hypothetical protein
VNAQFHNDPKGSLKLLLLVSLVTLSVQLHFAEERHQETHSEMVLHAEQGQADIKRRNADFPSTYISAINVDLTSPHHWVLLTWSGSGADVQDAGPFHSSPGAGRVEVDCNDCEQSNRGTSRCTPRGIRVVEGFSDTMDSAPSYRFVTWFHSSREIGFHSHPEVPDYPASHGCVRLDEHAAQLIHNNSIAGVTKVIVEGAWTKPSRGAR